jgi:hypothetical protein
MFLRPFFCFRHLSGVLGCTCCPGGWAVVLVAVCRYEGGMVCRHRCHR